MNVLLGQSELKQHLYVSQIQISLHAFECCRDQWKIGLCNKLANDKGTFQPALLMKSYTLPTPPTIA